MCLSWETIIFLISSVLTPITARFCMDSVRGSCESSNDWCLFEENHGNFGCDWRNQCEEISKKNQTNGCFVTKSGDTVCCCRQSDGCSIEFMKQVKKGNVQKCYHARESASGMLRTFRECEDPWCYTLFTYNLDGTLKMEFGCQSRTMVKHDVFQRQNKKYRNNTWWLNSETQYRQPRCSEITVGLDETKKAMMCYLFEYKGKHGRLCCCRGEDRCNQDFSIRSPSRTFDDLIRIRKSINSTFRMFHY
ncbi:unnamed protein product, partial [Mesorhabditis belari]|uniref:Uncharacterized protein n=1 Tax=Mesorhabditis belari TaxID=2138241 RepID=A0AAF3J390_9BILA